MKAVKLMVIALFLLVTMLVTGTALAAPGVTLTTPSTTVRVGEEFTVSVELTGVDQIQGAELLISYDQSKLGGLSIEPGFFMTNTYVDNEIKNGKAGIAIAALGMGNIITIPSDNKRVAVLNFKAQEPGTTVIKVDRLEVVLPVLTGIPETVLLGSPEIQLVVQQAGASGNNNNVNPGNNAGNVTPDPGNGNIPATGNTGSGNESSNPGISATVPGNGNQPPLKDTSQRPQGRSPVDVVPGHWAHAAIQQLIDDGYASGYEDGSFKPEQEITRAEFLALVTRILGLEGASTSVNINDTFSDGAAVPAWARGVVASAYANGLVQGDEQGRFRPNAPISRAEIAAIVIRALGEEEQSKTVGPGQQAFTDSTQAGWAASYLSRGKQLGLMTGYEDGSFRPNNQSTRAEAAALVSRMLGRLQPGTGR